MLVAMPDPAPGRARYVALHPVSEVRLHAEGLDRLERAMRARIERLVPFLNDGKPVITAATSRAHPLFDAELDPIAGVARVSIRTPYKNVLIAGPVVLPGLGAEGEHLSALTRDVGRTLLGVAHDEIRARVAQALLRLAVAHSETTGTGLRIPVRLSQATLGSIVGATRENVNRALASLLAAGDLSHQDGYYVVHRRAALEALCAGHAQWPAAGRA